MRLWIIFGFSLVFTACANPSVYWNPNASSDEEIFTRERPKAIAFFHAKKVRKSGATTTSTEGATSSTPTPNPYLLFRMNSVTSQYVAPTGQQFSTQAADTSEVVWERIPVDDTTQPRATVQSSDSHYCPKFGDTDWDHAYELFTCGYSKVQAAKVLGNTMPPIPIAVEPEYAFFDSDYLERISKSGKTKSTSTSPTPLTTIVDTASPIWPVGKTMTWHRDDQHSQLDSALKQVINNHPSSTVKVAHLDSGYFSTDDLRPKRLLREESETCLPKGTPCRPDSEAPKEYPVAQTDMTHGSRTLSVLAGGTATVETPQTPTSLTLGAYPQVPVASFRITKELPVHFNATAMALAIQKAAGNYDVITLSQGGFPSGLLKDAVNTAYEQGTAIFAATGDFFTVPFLFGITPHTVAFPARFNRVMAVSGITADHTNYAVDPCYFCLWRIGQWDNWILRGSYGPISSMSQHSIAAYAPNITTSYSQAKNQNAIQLDGQGVSFAVPQAAAAAALWLQYHQADFTQKEWRSWKKTEAVYQALMESANTKFPGYSCEYMGHGALRASTALAVSKDTALEDFKKMFPEKNYSPNDLAYGRPTATIDSHWILDAILTTDILREVIMGTATGGFTFDTQFRHSIQQMVLTELQQLLHRSDDATRLYNKLIPTLTDKHCPTEYSANTSLLIDFLKHVLGEKHVSAFLKKTLQHTLNLQLAKTTQVP